MFEQLWKTLRTALLVIGILLSFFAFIEMVRAYQVLREWHPAVGFLFLAVLFAGVAWGIVRYCMEVARRPSILTAPVHVDSPETSLAEWPVARITPWARNSVSPVLTPLIWPFFRIRSSTLELKWICPLQARMVFLMASMIRGRRLEPIWGWALTKMSGSAPCWTRMESSRPMFPRFVDRV